MELANLVNQHKNKILNLSIIILSLFISGRIYKAQTRTIESLKEKTRVEMEKNAALEELAHLEKKSRAFKDAINKKDISLITDSIATLAKDYAIRIVSFNPLPQNEYPDYTQYSFNLTLNTESYHLLAKFLNKLESSLDIYVFDSADISFREEKGRESLVGELTLSTILVKD